MMASRNGGVSYWKSVVVHDVTVEWRPGIGLGRSEDKC